MLNPSLTNTGLNPAFKGTGLIGQHGMSRQAELQFRNDAASPSHDEATLRVSGGNLQRSSLDMAQADMIKKNMHLEEEKKEQAANELVSEELRMIGNQGGQQYQINGSSDKETG